MFVGFTYSSSILPTVRGSLCNDDSPWKTMGILKDIRHIHSESPSWSYRAFFNSDLWASFIGFMGFLLVKQGTWPFAKLIFKSIVDFFPVELKLLIFGRTTEDQPLPIFSTDGEIGLHDNDHVILSKFVIKHWSPYYILNEWFSYWLCLEYINRFTCYFTTVQVDSYCISLNSIQL